MKHIVIAQPLAISSALLDTLTTDLQKDGFTITAYDSLPKDQGELGDRLADADLAVIANYPLRKFGIIGTGAIGRRVADIASAFGADVYGYSRSRKAASITYTDLDTLLSTCDIISVHLPLTSETRGLLSREKLSLMKPGAILINTARGGVIDNADLADLLWEGKIAGAGIDVFDGEPPLAKDNPLLSAPNTVLTPHVGFFTEEAMARRAVIVMDNLRAYLKGEQENVIC